DASVASALVVEDEVVKELSRRIIRLRQITQHKENIAQLWRRIIPEFMSHAPVEEWAEKANGSAALELERLITTKATEHASKTQTEITVTPVELPVDQFFTLPPGPKHSRVAGRRRTREFPKTAVLRHLGQGPVSCCLL